MTAADAPYHVHVYFTPDRRSVAAELRETMLALAARTNPPVSYVGRLHNGPIGPHPLPMMELHATGRTLPEVEAAVRGSGLTALIHPWSPDHLGDHTVRARWIGTPLDLNLEVLRNL